MNFLQLYLIYIGVGFIYSFLDLIYEYYFGDLEKSFTKRYNGVIAGTILLVIITWPIWLSINILSVLVKVILR